MSPLRQTGVAAATIGLLALAGCTSNVTPTDAKAAIAVTSTADACEVAPVEAPSGTLVFTVTNTGSQTTEFYLYGEDGETVVAEVENIGPGLSRDMVVEAEPGAYITACKPGMAGDGIRAAFTVTE